jgi:hypothetical protein
MPLLFSSCLFEEKDIFDESAAVRKYAAVVEYDKILQSAPNGWVFDYYPHEARPFGGFNYIVKFGQGDTVRAAFENERTPEIKQSLYSILYDFGAMLSFNSYNPYLHFFAEAEDSGALYQGRKGDYEFMLMDYDEDEGELKLKGKRTTNYMTMTKLGSDVVWSDYLDGVNATEAQWYFADYTIYVDDKEVGTATKSDRNITFTWTEDGKEKKVTQALIYKPDGQIRFYNEIVIAGVPVRNFKYDASTNTATSTEPGKKVALKAFVPEDFVSYDQYLGDWTIKSTSGLAYTVTFSQKERNKSFNMTFDVLPELTIEWRWSSSFSGKRLTLSTQHLATTPEGNLVLLMTAYRTDSGGTSFFIQYNESAETAYYTFDGENTITCTGGSNSLITGFVLYIRNSANSGNIGWYQAPNSFLGTSLTR